MSDATTTNAVPSPGTDEAIRLGCSCPVMDNHHGRGYHGTSGVFVYSYDCRLHYPGMAAMAIKAVPHD